jgi:hypothetical protein
MAGDFGNRRQATWPTLRLRERHPGQAHRSRARQSALRPLTNAYITEQTGTARNNRLLSLLKKTGPVAVAHCCLLLLVLQSLRCCFL